MGKKIADVSSGGKGYQIYENSDGSKSVYRNDWLGKTHVGTAKPGGNASDVVKNDSGSSKAWWK